MRVVLVLEVKSIVHLSDIDGLFGGIMLQNHLFKVKECAFVVDTLSHLDL